MFNLFKKKQYKIVEVLGKYAAQVPGGDFIDKRYGAKDERGSFNDYTWGSSRLIEYCSVDTIDEAEKLIETYRSIKHPKTIKTIEV